MKAKVGDTVQLTAAGIEHVEQFVLIDDAESWTGDMEGEVEKIVGEVAWIRFPIRIEEAEGEEADLYLWDLAEDEFEVVKEAQTA